ncbi:hypothetical protein [Methylobacterium sp. 391_Methyba4]|uniref:hypothetical protein n=1 Tax=Methylobacterium sp. 391_Methyba4 TaxID=3038924 RepID=UPI00241E4690|nr:hypothetical protein [Methylobacterium sp. 391_Methyba4]WFS06248.1 hypothetical protein P9K36_23025 [Methylobacterium sp. 391_Methyba4]
MIVRTQADRTEAVDALQAMVADWRTRTMPAEEQARFDAIAADIDDYDAQVAARPGPAPPEPPPARLEPQHPPLAAKFTAFRQVRSDADRAVAVADRRELLADWRARTMPDHAQLAFDSLTQAIDAYDAEQVAAHEAGPSIHESNLAFAAAFRAKR